MDNRPTNLVKSLPANGQDVPRLEPMKPRFITEELAIAVAAYQSTAAPTPRLAQSRRAIPYRALFISVGVHVLIVLAIAKIYLHFHPPAPDVPQAPSNSAPSGPPLAIWTDPTSTGTGLPDSQRFLDDGQSGGSGALPMEPSPLSLQNWPVAKPRHLDTLFPDGLAVPAAVGLPDGGSRSSPTTRAHDHRN